MLYEFQQKIKRLSLGKRKFLLNKMNAFIALDEEIWRGNTEEQSSKLLSEQDKVREQFIYGASLLLEKGKTLKETSALVKDTFSVTSAQYEYYTMILERYGSELTSSGRKAFCANIMRTSSSKKISPRSRARINQKD